MVGPLWRCSWRERQTDKLPDRYDWGITELSQTEQVLVFADDELRFGGCSAFENAVVVGIFPNDVQRFGRGDAISEREQLASRVL